MKLSPNHIKALREGHSRHYQNYRKRWEKSKRCGACGIEKERKHFHQDKSRPDGKSFDCIDCFKASRVEWKTKNPSLSYERHLRKHLREKFGITLEDFNALLEKQSGGCAICGVISKGKKRLVVDHDHKTGKVRGLLCSLCNTGLGFFRDDANRLRCGAAYLQPEMSGQSKSSVIFKNWGYELVLISSDLYCAKELVYFPGWASSLHYHKEKSETFTITEGKCKIEWGEGNSREFCVGDQLTLPAGTQHRVSNPFNRVCKILEVSTKHDDKDVFRISPSRPFEE